MGVVEQSAEDSIAEGRVSGEIVPGLDGDLASQEGASPSWGEQRSGGRGGPGGFILWIPQLNSQRVINRVIVA